MSDIIYPLALVGGELSVTDHTRVLTDIFEAGTTSRRALWPDHHFRRVFDFTHTGLTQRENEVLKEFYGDRNGPYDSFWFRDSVNRSGNHKVGFADDHKPSIGRMNRVVPVRLVETSTRRSLPSLEEVKTAAGGVSPGLWFDAQREAVITHLGAETYETAPWNAATRANEGTWNGTGAKFTGLTVPYSRYAFNGLFAGIGPAPASFGSTPGCAVFVIARALASATRQVAFSLGRVGTNLAVGLVLDADNKFQPYLGHTSGFAGAFVLNSPTSTWRSFLIDYSTDGTQIYIHANGSASPGYGTTGSLVISTPSYWGLGASPEDTLRSTGLDVGTAIWFPESLGAPPTAEAAALHNLFAYQYGLATV